MNKIEKKNSGKHSINNNKKTEQPKTEQKNTTTNPKSKRKTIKIITISIISILIITIIAIILFSILRPKIKSKVQIELGTQEIKIQDFLTEEKDAEKAEFITDINQIDLSKVGTHEITIKLNNKEYKTILEIKDTTAPEVKFQDVCAYTDYQINPEDFIAEKKDKSNMEVSLGSEITINGFGDYHPIIIVKDEYGNETSKECLLSISYIKNKITLEYGNKLTKQDLLFNFEEYQDTIKQEDIDVINASDVGEYELKSNYQGQEKTTKITIQDTIAPELVLKNVSIYTGQTITDPNQIVEKAEDLAGVTLNILTEINYSTIGDQEITIEATDGHGNKTTQKAILITTLAINIGILIIIKSEIIKNIIIPMGISYYTFQVVSYLIDVYRNKYKPEKNIAKYFLYTMYFPYLFIGPINRYDDISKTLFETEKNSIVKVPIKEH